MQRDIQVPVDGIALSGTLAFPAHALGIVIFAHGSGSNRRSPRNRHIAEVLQAHRLATMLVDLTTAEEDRIDALETTLRFDVDMLADRLIGVTTSLIATGETRGLPIGYMGGGTGAAAALIAAARSPARIAAVVTRGGRPELATPVLDRITAPALLIVGAEDRGVLAANRLTASQLYAPHALEIVPGATHLFEEAGALEQVAQLAARWFVDRFAEQPATRHAAL